MGEESGEPLGVLDGSVEVGGGFELLVVAILGGGFGFGEEGGDLLAVERLEGAEGGEGLLDAGHGVHAGDDAGDGQGEGVVEELDGIREVGASDGSEAEGLHGEDADAFFLGDGDDLVLEGAEVGVHGVDGHLEGIEVEVVGAGDVQHVKVDAGVFVAGEADEAEFAGFAGGDGGREGGARGEDGFGVGHADDFVELNEVDDVGLEAAEGVFELGVEAFGGVAVGLGHEEDLVAVAVAEGLSHALFGAASVVVPGVVHEGDSGADGGAHEEDGFGVVLHVAEVGSAETDGGDALAGGAEGAGEGIGGEGLGGREGWSESGCGGGFEEVAASHENS